MKILVAGDWHSEVHEKYISESFKTLGHDTHRFSWHEYFRIPQGRVAGVVGLLKRFQNKFNTGPAIKRINEDFLRASKGSHYDCIFVYHGAKIKAATLRLIKKNSPSTVLVVYNNDDPFSKAHPLWQWRLFLPAVPEYDIVFAYRHHNLDEYKRAGAKKVYLLRSYYVPERNHPVTLSQEDKGTYTCDVVFAGHYEPDGRVGMMEEIVKQGFQLRLYGDGKYWNPALKKSKYLGHLIPIQSVWGEDYNKALCGAKVALCFLSKLNRDTYTRRCFEIPATKTFMLSEYSDDLAALFNEGIEADYFRSEKELVQKLNLYVNKDELREKVALAGYNRVIRDGHDVVSRMKQVLEWVNRSRKERDGEGI